MDDERIELALRLGPVGEPAYQPRDSWRSTRDADDASDTPEAPRSLPPATRPGTGAPGLERLRPVGVRVRDTAPPGRRSIPVTIAASIALIASALLIVQAGPFGPAATPGPTPDLLGRLMAAGSAEIAVTNTAPQTVSQGGAYIGFDVDVAKAIAEQLGLQATVTVVAPGSLGSGTWELALPGHGGQRLGGSVSQPYAYWPVWLAAPDGSRVTDLASLATARVCVVAGSAGADWLAGSADGATATAPPGATAVTMASDDACVAAVGAGRVDALVTESLLTNELQARGLHLVVATPVVSDPWAVVVRGSAADAASLLAAVNDAIAALHRSGRLADLSRSSFGGQDIAVPAP
jgi:ABC-type amino acid transport substrate-binding protein